ncbi:terpene synthase family protein [Streptomyces sp. NPDC058401]|uniref:terpene synthase family protein n=1 Tax=Streptomyces sp. NPDC058401 TaxID=3346480 RepID=UPI00364CAC9F
MTGIADDSPVLTEPAVVEAVLSWARAAGLVADDRQERRLAAMRLDVLAAGALPQGAEADVVLTAQWAAFVCWVDDRIDRHSLGARPGELERFTAPLRQVLDGGGPPPGATAPHAVVLAQLWERTAEGMPGRWRERFAADYGDFLDATAQEVALRRDKVPLGLEAYLRLRRRTITLLPVLDVLERTGHTPLVEDPRVDAQVRDLRWAVADVAGWANDLASVADDLAAGQDNLVTVLARERSWPVAQAREHVAEMIEQRRMRLLATVHILRTASGLPDGQAAELHRYVGLVETFMTATLRWLACTGRFTPAP